MLGIENSETQINLVEINFFFLGVLEWILGGRGGGESLSFIEGGHSNDGRRVWWDTWFETKNSKFVCFKLNKFFIGQSLR